MEALHKNYQAHLDTIAAAIQESEALTAYLDEEGEEEYKVLIQTFEPSIDQVYEMVATNDPLQLVSFETALLKSEFEGLYLPKVLGYSVLRGQIDSDTVKYNRPQNHFKDVLTFITGSSNFEQIQKRVGQSIQIGFSLSSDIWITNIIEGVTNKKVKYFLQNQKLHKLRDIKQRWTGLVKYRRQFHSLNYYTADFPTNTNELIVEQDLLKHFILYRFDNKLDNKSLNKYVIELINNEALYGQKEIIDTFILVGLYFELDDAGQKYFSIALKKIAKKYPNFDELFFAALKAHWIERQEIEPVLEKRFSAMVPRDISDSISEYYDLLDLVHGKGYVHEEALEVVNNYYYKHEGRSDENYCLRSTILSYLHKFLNNLDVESYTDYFELNKIITLYINTFSNQQFNQDVKELSLAYVKRLLKKYIDKRGRDYQDIKKFVRATFRDLGFMTDKQLTELFKTRRKK